MNQILCYSKANLKASQRAYWEVDYRFIFARRSNYFKTLLIWYFLIIRLRSDIPEGEITKRAIFKLMPFENELVVLS